MSPFPAVSMPDVEQVWVDYLLANLPGPFVGTEWPPNWETRLGNGIIAVSLGGGGSRQRDVTADRTIDVDVLAADKGQARDLAATVSALMIAARGTTQPGARIYDVSETSVVWLPYQPSAETDPIPRYVLVMSTVIRPA